MSKLRAIIYKRGSKDEIHTENQDAAIMRIVEYNDYELVGEYVENESSYQSKQYEFERLKKDATKRKFDVVVVWALDRMCRKGVQEIYELVKYFSDRQISLVFCKQPELSTTNSMVRNILLTLYAEMANMESRLISERTLAGLARAKAEGKTFGRPKGKSDDPKKPRVRRWKVAPKIH
jgi:DNA invertase Pin-like site-specific DNA recombinase